MKSPLKKSIGEVVTDYGARVMKVFKKGLLQRSLFDFYGDVKADKLRVKESSSVPATPIDGDGGVLYTKSADGKLYYKSNEVAEVELSANGGTITTTDTPSEGEVLVYNDSTIVWGHPEKIHLQVRNDEGSTIPAGAPLYSKIEIGGSGRLKVGICDANDPAKMPCIGLAEAEMNTTSTKDNFAITQGIYNTNISGFTGLAVGDTLYVDTSGSAPHLTKTKPTGESSLIQNVGIVVKTNGTICQGLQVSAIGRTNDVPNLNSGYIFYGNGSNQASSTQLSTLLPPDLTVSGTGTIDANNVPTLNQNTTGNAATADALTSGNKTITGNLTVTTEFSSPRRKFTRTDTATHFDIQGDVLYFGSGSTTQGDLCYLKEDGSWGQADANGAATGDDADRDAMGMLAIALGTDPDINGMLIRGIITMDYDLGDVGNPVYVKTTAGGMSHIAPSGSGDFVRVVGYCLDDDHGVMYFNPDNTWVEIA